MSTDIAKRKAMQDMQLSLIKDGQLSSCISCEKWDNKNELCEKWNMRPPAHVIVVGCPYFIQDVPF